MQARNDKKIRRLIGITGATGFIGDYLLGWLSSSGRYDIRALSRSPAGIPPGMPGVSWQRGDLASTHDCEEFVFDLDVVIHLAHANTPLSSQRDWTSDALLNLIPSLNLIEAMRRARRPIDFVFASSGGAIYGRRDDRTPFREIDPTYPQSPYGVVKLAVEHYLRLAAEEDWLRVTILRIGNPYGKLLAPERRQGLIGVAMYQALRGMPIPIYGNPHNIRDYIHLSDVARIVEFSLEPTWSYEIFNVGSGGGASTAEIVDLIEKSVGSPISLCQAPDVPGADRLPSWAVLDIGKAAKALGWTPQIPLSVGIERLYQDRKDIKASR
jgi:UDP-glucose 4-epimerase